jgi:hypothetical protein
MPFSVSLAVKALALLKVADALPVWGDATERQPDLAVFIYDKYRQMKL